jgi:hypothetical protein
MKRHIISVVVTFLVTYLAIQVWRAGYETYVMGFVVACVTNLMFQVYK